MAWWWVANAILIVAVVPAVVTLAHRVLTPIREIRRYVADIGSSADGVGQGLAGTAGLQQTAEWLESAAAAAGAGRGGS